MSLVLILIIATILSPVMLKLSIKEKWATRKQARVMFYFVVFAYCLIALVAVAQN